MGALGAWGRQAAPPSCRTASYTGPVRPTLGRFVERSFPSGQAEFAALEAGTLSVGYLPSADVTGATTVPGRAGPNNPCLTGYTLAPLYTFSVNYALYNFHSTGDGGTAGWIIDQLYVRQAIQSLVDQPQPDRRRLPGLRPADLRPGAAVGRRPGAPAGTQPLPLRPGPGGVAAQPPTAGRWSAGGTSTCQAAGTGAGQCGSGIPAGRQAGPGRAGTRRGRRWCAVCSPPRPPPGRGPASR